MKLLVFKEDNIERYAVVEEVTKENVIKAINSFSNSNSYYQEFCKNLYIDDNYGHYMDVIEWTTIRFYIEEVNIIGGLL